MTQTCEQWHGAIAVEALGGLEPEERAGLLAHLDGCAACRDEARALGEVVATLALVDADHLEPTASLPPALTERVLGSLHDQASNERRRHRVRVGAMAGAALAVAASLVTVIALSSSPAPRVVQRSVALRGAGAATATAVLSSRTWGTEIRFSEQGLPAGGVYEVSMRTSAGTWWSTGSVRATGRNLSVPMSCYVPVGQITGIRVTDARGDSVLRSNPNASW